MIIITITNWTCCNQNLFVSETTHYVSNEMYNATSATQLNSSKIYKELKSLLTEQKNADVHMHQCNKWITDYQKSSK